MLAQISTSTPKLTSETLEMPSNRGHEAVTRGRDIGGGEVLRYTLLPSLSVQYLPAGCLLSFAFASSDLEVQGNQIDSLH